GQVTVTTKYGIPAAKRQGLISMARSVARPIVKAVPGLKRGLTSAAAKATSPGPKPSFTAAEARKSLDRSLRELKTDRIDIWLLHTLVWPRRFGSSRPAGPRSAHAQSRAAGEPRGDCSVLLQKLCAHPQQRRRRPGRRP